MPITSQQIQNAQAQQNLAAHSQSSNVRLIAGPGTGKSFAIQERVRWLLHNGVSSNEIYVVSFTRASSRDLLTRVHNYCQSYLVNGNQVRISTLHSLALRTLRIANLLIYPSNPLVLDNWELKNIFDVEFSKVSQRPPGRCEVIRRDYEAFCGTGNFNPPNYIQPDPPITDQERVQYENFRTARTQIYSCVLPGEIVRQCVDRVNAGLLEPAKLLGIRHLIVDEYQDLNPVDLELVDGFANDGVEVFVAGDDDQSLYSFRFASPSGIQTFMQTYPNAAGYELRDCFRCTPRVLNATQALLNTFSDQGRIPKQLTSLYGASAPPVQGIVYRWRFPSGTAEASAIAASCNELIACGLPHREIMILIANTGRQLSSIANALEVAGIEFESPRVENFVDTNLGRFVLALLRITCDPNDYVAHRSILGLLPNVGPTTCNNIAEDVIGNNLNYRDVFYNPLPAGVFRGRQQTALNFARNICASITNWNPDDTLAARSFDIESIISSTFGQQYIQEWLNEINNLPLDITLKELRDFLWSDTDDHKSSLLEAVYTRLNMTPPAAGFLPSKIRIMTMHGAKGLDSGVVFIPGLEEDILPGIHQQRAVGLVHEAARMLYVSITRAKAACIVSYAETRIVHGQFSRPRPSRFAPHLNGNFVYRDVGLSDREAQDIIQIHSNL